MRNGAKQMYKFKLEDKVFIKSLNKEGYIKGMFQYRIGCNPHIDYDVIYEHPDYIYEERHGKCPYRTAVSTSRFEEWNLELVDNATGSYTLQKGNFVLLGQPLVPENLLIGLFTEYTESPISLHEMKSGCECGANKVGSSKHSEWCGANDN